MAEVNRIINFLILHGDEKNVRVMRRYGIISRAKILGVPKLLNNSIWRET